MKRWLIYGSGKTGSLIAQEAVRGGETPLLVGRSAEKVKPIAEKLGLDWAVAELSDKASLSNLLEQVDLVVHTAGPFLSTNMPMIQACLAKGKHYLDISNEIPVFQSVFKLDDEARRRGVALIPGIGFGVAATDGLAGYVATQIKNPQELEIATHIYSEDSSVGADVTRLEALSRGGWARRNGTLIRIPLGSGGTHLEFPFGNQTILPIPSGDLEAAFRSTGVPNITTYGTFSISPFVARLALPVVQQIVSISGIRQRLEQRISRRANAPVKKKAVQESHSYAWARARNSQGDVFEAWQEMGEGYNFTAQAAVRAVQKVLSEPLTGALTPSQAFGTDFALLMNGTRRYIPTKG
jgi:short subunit dehydrogenase-like uncharacterized protein